MCIATNNKGQEESSYKKERASKHKGITLYNLMFLLYAQTVCEWAMYFAEI